MSECAEFQHQHGVKVMAEGSGKKQTISLGSDFDAVVRYGETTVELNADGVIVKTKGNVIVYTNGGVKVRPAAKDDGKSPGGPKPGDRMPDGAVYAGISTPAQTSSP